MRTIVLTGVTGLIGRVLLKHFLASDDVVIGVGRSLDALVKIKSDVASGATLSQAFSRHPKIFNELYVSMLVAGEEAGILEDVLSQISTLLEKDFEIQKGVNMKLAPNT